MVKDGKLVADTTLGAAVVTHAVSAVGAEDTKELGRVIIIGDTEAGLLSFGATAGVDEGAGVTLGEDDARSRFTADWRAL